MAMKIYTNKQGHKTKVAAMPICGKNLKNEYYQDCSNYYPGLTLTYFMPRSNLVTWAFAWAKVKIIYYLETVTAIGSKLVSIFK